MHSNNDAIENGGRSDGKIWQFCLLDEEQVGKVGGAIVVQVGDRWHNGIKILMVF